MSMTWSSVLGWARQCAIVSETLCAWLQSGTGAISLTSSYSLTYVIPSPLALAPVKILSILAFYS